MSKDFAFLFKPGDYLRDTQCLSERVQVAYDRIMCEHMRNICISQQQLNFFTKRLTDDEKAELLMVVDKITGGYEIAWVAESIRERIAYSDSRRKNREGKSSKHKKTYDKHMEGESDNDNDNVNVIEGGVGETINIPFETFWNLYGKKQDRIKCEGKWKRLSNKDRNACIDAIPAYVKSTPDIQYRKNPATYLNNKSWENEVGMITKPTPSNPTQNYINPNWVDDRICKR